MCLRWEERVGWRGCVCGGVECWCTAAMKWVVLYIRTFVGLYLLSVQCSGH